MAVVFLFFMAMDIEWSMLDQQGISQVGHRAVTLASYGEKWTFPSMRHACRELWQLSQVQVLEVRSKFGPSHSQVQFSPILVQSSPVQVTSNPVQSSSSGSKMVDDLRWNEDNQKSLSKGRSDGITSVALPNASTVQGETRR